MNGKSNLFIYTLKSNAEKKNNLKFQQKLTNVMNVYVMLFCPTTKQNNTRHIFKTVFPFLKDKSSLP